MKAIRIGTRGSKLALVQTHMVVDNLKAHYPETDIQIIEITTSGDWKPEHGEVNLSEVDGGKGLFAKEIENAILEGYVDCGVHSMKDMPSELPEGLVIEHYLPREDPRDALVTNFESSGLSDLPEGSSVGTSSPRRKAMLLSKRPDLNIKIIRGNVPTRLEKLKDNKYDSIILALSGLKRLGLEDNVTAILEPEEMLPAGGQGAIGIEVKQDNDDLKSILNSIGCEKTALCVSTERAVLLALGGSCHSPIGVNAILDDDAFFLRAVVCSLDGKHIYEEEYNGVIEPMDSLLKISYELGQTLKEKVPSEILEL